MAHWQGTFPANRLAASIMRGEMALVARECGLSESRVADVKLAVSEAVTNVVIHAYPDGEGTVSGLADSENGKLRIVISDSGVGMAPRRDTPGLGVGMPLIAALAEAVEIRASASGTQIHLTFACPAGA